jgi:precorrin-3B synthase
MTTFSRRGACPALSAPMQTGDGLLVRLNPLAGEIAPKVLIGLCESARRHGNGIVEITARGSIQIRGLSETSASLLAAEVDALGISVRSGVPVDTSPIAGIDPSEIANPAPLAAAIRAGIAEANLATRLGPKVSVVIDGRGQIGLGAIIGDIRLVAADASRWRLSVAGDGAAATFVGEFGTKAACRLTLDILHAVAALGREGRARDLHEDAVRMAMEGSEASHSFPPPSVLPDISPTRREIRPASTPALIVQAGSFVSSGNIVPSPIDEVAGRAETAKLPISPLAGGEEWSPRATKSQLLGFSNDERAERQTGRTEGGGKDRHLSVESRSDTDESNPETPRATDSSPIGILPLTDGRIALGIALPFGSLDAATLIDFCQAATNAGATAIRPAPGRSLLVMGLDRASAETLAATAKTLGLITSPTDPRIRIAACPGAPACASGMIAARDVATDIATNLGKDLDPTLTLHVSGCAKGCAHPGPAALTIVGDEKGAAFVVGGTAKGLPAGYTAGYEAAHGAGRLVALVAAERRPRENATACLTRLGAKRLARTIAQG